jgi:hypothetical protein
MAIYRVLLMVLLFACTALPAWASDSTDGDLLKLTITAYSAGEIYFHTELSCSPTGYSTASTGGGSKGAETYGFWLALSRGNAQPDARTAAEIARFGDNIQHVSFHGIDFMLHSSEYVDWIEIDMRSCQRSELESYRAVMQMSQELDQSIINKLFEPAGRIGFAAKRFSPVPWPQTETVERSET